MRKAFYWSSLICLIAILVCGYFWPWVYYFFIPWVPITLIGVYDIHWSKHLVTRNYPVIGHLRYMFEFIRPEIQQYFIATNQSGRPYNRETRTMVYDRAAKEEGVLPFGTQQDITTIGYESANHSMAPKKVPHEQSRIQLGGEFCKQPYCASRMNISAMSFGALSGRAVRALNLGAKLGNFMHNTGEGGLSKYHLKEGGDICWQLGTGYFGCRTKDGNFDPDLFTEKANLEVVKVIEIKISQGAKPSHGGLLPGAKVSKEIAEARLVEPGQDCDSPPGHREFSTPIELLEFVQRLRDMSNGKPVGFKFCLGRRGEFMAIVKAMLETGILPDFITVDGAEGGTGAAPVEFSDYLGAPINEGLVFVTSALIGANLRDKIRVIASGKVATGFDLITKIALGADMCNVARGMLFAVGCIQATRCNTNTCPTGITTQDPVRQKAIKIEASGDMVRNFHDGTIDSMLAIAGAMGLDDLKGLNPTMIMRRGANELSVPYDVLYHYLRPGELIENSHHLHPIYKRYWEAARPDTFAYHYDMEH
ncbi:MAG: FMN-binding glutamate synthase family protein [Coxiellaceae bacterium]|nr:FMN-binding glutamate synthase family protein [Coxiellaceae bacterium]